MVVAGFSGVFGILQTQWYVGKLKSIDPKNIQQMIRDDEVIQRHQALEYLKSLGVPQVGVLFHKGLFNDTQQQNLKEQFEILLQDKVLEDELQRSFGHSFKEVNAVVLPAWQLHNDFNRQPAGLTELGWSYATTPAGDSNVLGYTIRERPGNDAVTCDGTPRIALNLEAFVSKESLRLTLFHELLHAMNVPEFIPPRYCLLQTDLTYLPQYRSYVTQAGLEGWHERSTWIFVFAPWIVFCAAFYRVWRQRARIKLLRM
jgi:hypothetical protein